MTKQDRRETGLSNPTIAVCVPVRNERVLLPRLLAALLAQADAPHFHACFFLDSCTDDSEAVIRETLADAAIGWSVAGSVGVAPSNAGRARAAALAMGEAEVAPDGWLLTTDADSAPARNWVAEAAAALADVDLAAGRIVRDAGGADGVQDRVEAYWERLYRLRRRIDPIAWEPAAGHHFTGGANLAIRAAAYRALGGFQPLPSGEDAALVDAAGRAGLTVRRVPTMVVETSARRIGRAPGGLADGLRRLDRGGDVRIAHPEGAVWQYRAHAAARAAFARHHDPAVRAALGRIIDLSADHVLGVARDCPNAEAFAMRIVPACPSGERIVPLAQAEQALAAIEALALERAA